MGGLSRLASISSALLGKLGGEMSQNVAVATERLVLLTKCCCGSHSGGVPLPFVHHSNIISAFTHVYNVFDGFGGSPGLRAHGSERVTSPFRGPTR